MTFNMYLSNAFKHKTNNHFFPIYEVKSTSISVQMKAVKVFGKMNNLVNDRSA